MGIEDVIWKREKRKLEREAEQALRLLERPIVLPKPKRRQTQITLTPERERQPHQPKPGITLKDDGA